MIVRVRIPPGLPGGVGLCKRLKRMETKYGSVVQLARHAGLRNQYEDTLWVRIPPGLRSLTFKNFYYDC